MSRKTRKTANASRLFTGCDSYGRRVELADREGDGQWFYRSSNSYGGMSRWAWFTGEVKHPTTGVNKITEEEFTWDAQARLELVEWGFNLLRSSSPKGLRLPK